MNEQLAFKTSDAIKNISGVNQYSYNNSDFVLRGFRASSMRISTRGWAQDLLPHVERIEVIKGPASALFANTSPGGMVNTVTRKPLPEQRNAISFTTGSFNTYRITSDFTGPMNESKTASCHTRALFATCYSKPLVSALYPRTSPERVPNKGAISTHRSELLVF